jgi:hypothetical protein
LRRGRNISAGAVHGACRRMLLAVIADAHCLLVLCDVGPDPASFKFAVRPVVSHGPANAVPALKTTTEQPVRINRLISICASLFLPEALACQG